MVLRLPRRAALGAISIGLAAALLIPGTAWAPRVKGLPGYIGPCTMEVDGSPANGVFLGDIFVQSYEARSNQLLANLSITGSCRVGVDASGIDDATAETPATIEKANCHQLKLRLGNATVKDITLDLSRDTMDSTAEKSDKILLCAIAKTAKRGSTSQLAALLNLFFDA
jgi:hypothetical protein